MNNAETDSSGKRKKVLIISYYWPPAGGISPLRILKFVKYLRKFNWEPIVCVPVKADYLYLDSDNLKDIPDDLKILKTKIVEPFKLFKLLSGRKKNDTNNPLYGNNTKKSIIDNFAVWVRGNFFIPDARCLWIKPTVKFLSEFIKNNPVDAILTDGPPHTNTVIGMRLSEKFNIPWLADFQDPWTQVDYYKLFKLTKFADKKHRKTEQKVFKIASKITIASPSWLKDLESIGARNISVIYYGYDEDDFKDIDYQENDDFIISHTGILSQDRNPDIFFKVLKNICDENKEFKQKLKLIFAGPVDESVRESIKKNGLQNNYIEKGNIPRKDALSLNISSKILLLPVNKAENAKGRIPGKLYEYLRARVPILCYGPQDGDVADIIRKTNSGKIFKYSNYQDVRQFIEDNFNHFKKNNITDISEFTNENQTKLIAEYLDEITN
ncbi:MAG: glycosyltransferase family 4 protein [Chlorobi bacterium]|nr:glycosyltransferase family 4 protein [Chlorobiota bacterium]